MVEYKSKEVNRVSNFQLTSLLTTLGFSLEQQSPFSDATLEKPVFVSNKKQLRLVLHNPTPLPFFAYQAFVEGLQKSFKVEVILAVLTKNPSIQLAELQQYIRYYLSNSDSHYRFKDVLIRQNIDQIDCLVDQQDQPFFADILKQLDQFLLTCGFSVSTKMACDTAVTTMKEFIKPQDEPKPIVAKKTSSFRRRKREDALLVSIKDIAEPITNVKIEGEVFHIESRFVANGEQLLQMFYVSDQSDSITCKRFARSIEDQNECNELSIGDVVSVMGDIQYDTFSRELAFMARQVDIVSSSVQPVDTAAIKRVEWHAHSKMSEMDAVSTVEELIEQAFAYGHPGVAITDHMVVQAFPKAQSAVKKLKKKYPDQPFKMIYGVEMNMAESSLQLVSQSKGQMLRDMTMVVFDLETTGLSARYDHIIEFGAVKIVAGQIVDRVQFFIKPPVEIPPFITEKTNIRNEDVMNALTIDQLMPKILSFMGDHVLVAHNASFDIRFMNENLRRMQLAPLKNTVIDTLDTARALIKDRKAFKLGKVARYYQIPYDEDVAHRADYDAEIAGSVVISLLKDAVNRGCVTVDDLQNVQDQDAFKSVMRKHVNVIAKNQEGLKSLFELVTLSHTDYLAFFGKANSKKEEEEFMAEPRIIREEIVKRRKHLLIGSSCYNGEIFEIAANQSQENLESAMKFYDYIEVQPPSNYVPLLMSHSISSEQRLLEILKNIISTARKLNIPVLATGDVHYVYPKQKQFRDIYIQAQGIGGVRHPLYYYNPSIRAKAVAPDQHFRSTEDMLTQFQFLDRQLAYEIVVENTRKLLEQLDEIFPIKSDLYTPSIEGADDKLTQICYQTAKEIYGHPLPEVVSSRLAKELTSIISNGFGVIYYISHLLVKKSLDDGYLVGSRGSVGSSLVATMSSITEVNPLPPHYVCPNCQHHEFFFEGEVGSGFDLPDKFCTQCNHLYRGDGQDIPFETFLGFEGDKVPDIDLNFSGDYQEKAHAYTKVLFGEDYVYRAGTIGTVAQKTAFGYVSGYSEEKGIVDMRQAQRIRLAMGCEGVKRTTGQHPGGIIVIPNTMDVHDFTPVQFPANNPTSEWKTTHFEFADIHDNLLKLDILGHVDPTAMKLLEEISGIDPKTIPMNDAKVMSIFRDLTALNIDTRSYTEATGAVGLPEFGTTFVREILKMTQPKNFSDLVRISGLSHGTDVWLNNAKDLVANGLTLSDVIGCRDDIMVYLIHKGLAPKQAFDIMESVRKGRGLRPDWIELMKENHIEDWYVDSCQKIKYMFPKAHAVAYVIMAVRVAWFKVYHPLAYYASYFTLRCNAYDIDVMRKGSTAIRAKLLDIDSRLKDNTTKLQVTNKERELYSTLEVALEMTLRGYRFSNIDLHLSDASTFMPHPTDSRILIPPFTVLDGLGENVGKSIVAAREEVFFISKEDLQSRTQLNGTSLRKLEVMGVLEGLQDENQLSLF